MALDDLEWFDSYLSAILTFFIPFILANLDVMDGGIGTGILSIYLSGFLGLGLGIVANIIVAISIKKDKESDC
jgi:tetrahydromethanopterin S-methyltransferase subunit C